MKKVYIIFLGLFLCFSSCACSVNSSYAVSGAVLNNIGIYNLDPEHKLPFIIECHFVIDKFENRRISLVCGKCDELDPQDYRVFFEYTHVNGDVDKVICDVKHKIPRKSVNIYLNFDDINKTHTQIDNIKRIDFSWAVL